MAGNTADLFDGSALRATLERSSQHQHVDRLNHSQRYVDGPVLPLRPGRREQLFRPRWNRSGRRDHTFTVNMDVGLPIAGVPYFSVIGVYTTSTGAVGMDVALDATDAANLIADATPFDNAFPSGRARRRVNSDRLNGESK